MTPRQIELLSPALNAATAIEAVKHGADAVYIGATSHGARKMASNSLDDIAKVVDFAHQFRSKVYVTVNTIIYENEIKEVEKLCRELYHIGVDALIVQDMGMLRMKLPPISLHASTQCDIRTPEKAQFLEGVGFSQIVLARELTIDEIKEITSSVSVPVECFVHGALCVSYSGKCHASLALSGRSANRGECSQICRYPFTLTDSAGKILARDKYLLSLKDLNGSLNLKEMMEAGVRSFKIEGRLKDISYVKNITSHYNNLLNNIISGNKDRYRRSSKGDVILGFTPDPYKSFNRSFTDYFQKKRQPDNIATIHTPKSLGEPINDFRKLHNGDGISFFNKEGVFTGLNINRIEGNKIIGSKKIEIPRGSMVYRTSDLHWDKLMKNETASRKIKVDIILSIEGIYARDERGLEAFMPFDISPQLADKEIDYRNIFAKMGNTIYELNSYEDKLPSKSFFPFSWMTQKRREVLEALDKANVENYPFEERIIENKTIKYPHKLFDFRENVSNSLAAEFYKEHGIKDISFAEEVEGKIRENGKILMTTRHCVLRELGKCLKNGSNTQKCFTQPCYLNYKGGRLKLRFNCNKCEMEVLYAEK